MHEGAIHQDGDLRRRAGSGAGGKLSVQREHRAQSGCVDCEMHRRIHGGGVTKPLQNAPGIQGEAWADS